MKEISDKRGKQDKREMQEWEKQFDEIALEKGRKLYHSSKVRDFKQEGEKLSAVFAGVQVYRVEMALEKNLPVRMHCQCPKARGGSKCEHMAAILFYLFGDREAEQEKAGRTGTETAGGRGASKEAGRGRTSEKSGRRAAEKGRGTKEKGAADAGNRAKF